MKLREPTADECSKNSLIAQDEYHRYYGIWYPQMGGYIGKAIAKINSCIDPKNAPCFEVYVWHDGDFPFGDGNPVLLHHCMAEQFIDFGIKIQKLQEWNEPA